MGHKEKALYFSKGFVMGMADLVPGISGGTVAMLTGIYERFLFAIGSLRLRHLFVFLSLLVNIFHTEKRKHYRSFLEEIDLLFLVLVFGGILTAVFSMSHLIHYLLQAFPLFMKGLFFTLILVGIVKMLRDMAWSRPTFFCFLSSSLFSFWFFFYVKGGLSLTDPPLAYLCFSGFVSIGAMLLPGISGSYILLLMGSYERVLEMVKGLEFLGLAPFVLSLFLGFLIFSRSIKWLLKKHSSLTFATLVGLMVGSLQVLWPWS